MSRRYASRSLMLDNKEGMPLVATHVGALPRPQWYDFNFHGQDVKKALMYEYARAQYDDALKAILKDQELAGMDIVSDGGLRYDQIAGGGWSHDIVDRLGGITWTDQITSRRTEFPVLSSYHEEILARQRYPNVTEKLDRGTINLAELFRLTQSKTPKPVKFSLPDAVVTRRLLVNGYYKDETELFFDLTRVYNMALRELSAAGCKIIQLDTPLHPLYRMGDKPSTEDWRILVEGFNKEIEGVDAQIWMHLCWGRAAGQVGALAGKVSDIAAAFPHIAECKSHVIQLESASTMGKNLDNELSQWKEYCPDRDVVVGVVNHRTTAVESIATGTEIIKKALKYVPPEKLGVGSDCGLILLPRLVAQFKLKAISTVARECREELLGWEQE